MKILVLIIMTSLSFCSFGSSLAKQPTLNAIELIHIQPGFSTSVSISNMTYISGQAVSGQIEIPENGNARVQFGVDYSDTHGLAMFSLPEEDCPHLKLGSGSQLQQETQVYTISSPAGLTYTVTSGIFSGYRRENGYEVLQTYAPINPGNSGGPLITQDGRVIGINTAILRGTEGIGFSLPIRYALDDFNLR